MLLENRVFRTFVLALAGCVVVFYVVGLMLADRWQASTTRTVNAPVERVESLLRDLATWSRWSGWRVEEGAGVRLEVRGEPGVPGQELAWFGAHGELILRLTKVEGERVDYDFLSRGGSDAAPQRVGNGHVSWRAVPQGTEVTWCDGGELALLVARWQAWFGSLQSQVQGHQEASIAGLAAELADG